MIDNNVWDEIYQKRNTFKNIDLQYPDGTISTIMIKGVTVKDISELNHKYDQVISKAKSNWKFKILNLIDKGSINKALSNIENRKSMEIMLLGLVDKPEGNIEQQFEFIENNLLAGHQYTLVEEIMKVSGFKI
jgi:hypothetical protein